MEIHPETPKEGMPLSKRFGEDGLKMMALSLKKAGKPLGIQFGNLSWLSNSRIALESSEYAKDMGKFQEFHEKVFHAYFAEGRDIGNMDVILEAADSIGLNREGLKGALKKGIYRGRLEEAQIDAERRRINSTPTFIINDEHKIVGSQPIEVFRKLFRGIE